MLKKLWNSWRNPENILSEYKHRLNENKEDQGVVIRKKNVQIKQFESERSRLIDLYQTGIVEKDEIEKKLKGVKSKMEQLRNEIKHLNHKDEERSKIVVVIDNLEKFSLTIGENLEKCSFEEKKKIVRLLIEEVEVDTVNDKINIKHIIPMKKQKYPLCCRTADADSQTP